MKIKLYLIFLLAFSSLVSLGQSAVKTEEITIRYSDGYQILDVVMANPKTQFMDEKEYFWYNEISKLQFTKGGCGGKLLHGACKTYNLDGKLISDWSFYLGLKDGTQKNWDENGDILSTSKYNKGEIIYSNGEN